LFTREDTTVEEKLTKLEKTLVAAGFELAPRFQEVVALFASLLSLPFLDRYPPLAMRPNRCWLKSTAGSPRDLTLKI
jgi:hypothetical protein